MVRLKMSRSTSSANPRNQFTNELIPSLVVCCLRCDGVSDHRREPDFQRLIVLTMLLETRDWRGRWCDRGEQMCQQNFAFLVRHRYRFTGRCEFVDPERLISPQSSMGRTAYLRAIVKSGVWRVGHAAALLSSVTSMPSLNLTPSITFPSWRKPRSRRQDCSALMPIL